MQIIGTLQMVTVFTDEEYDTLITGTTKYAAKLLKKTDQCRMVAQCAHQYLDADPTARRRKSRRGTCSGVLEAQYKNC